MTVVFYLLALLIVGFLLASLFVRANPTRVATTVNTAGPIALGAVGVALLLIGRAGLGGMALSAAAAWFASARMKRARKATAGGRSTVRSAALEMELDHDTGEMDGLVLAGSYETRTLGSLDLADLLSLRGELAADRESMQLLEAYLDSRFPVWREDVDPDGDAGEGIAPGSGPMTEKEAYQVLGLEAGASTTEIRQAHRRLMQRLHPDLGGSSFLAARINEAKDVLLSHHR